MAKTVAPKGKNAKVTAKQAQLVASMMKGKKGMKPEVESAAEDKMPDEEAE